MPQDIRKDSQFYKFLKKKHTLENRNTNFLYFLKKYSQNKIFIIEQIIAISQYREG